MGGVRVQAFIDEALEEADQRAATDTFRALFAWLRTDITGRDAHDMVDYDPLNILRHFTGDDRLDERYRKLNLEPMAAQLESKRTSKDQHRQPQETPTQ